VQEPFVMPVAVMQIGFVSLIAEHCALEVHGTQLPATKNTKNLSLVGFIFFTFFFT